MRIIKLIPVSEQAVQKLESYMQKNIMFNNVEQFIVMYNMGVLDPRNPTINRAVDEILSTFRNLIKLNGRLVVETPVESAIKNTISLMKDWEVVIKLKRLATLLVGENYPLDTKIVFTTQQNGKPMITKLDENGEEHLENYWASEKVINKTSDFANNIYTMTRLKTYKDDEDSCYFLIEDLVDIDDSFVLQLEQILRENTIR